MRPRRWLRALGFVLLLLYVAITAIAFLQYFRTGRGLNSGILFLVVGAYLLYFFFLGQPRVWRRHFLQQKSLQLPLDLVFDSEGMQSTSAIGSGRIPWSYFRKWRSGKHTILVYQTDIMINIVPKHLLSPAQLAALESLLLERLGRAA